jgi:hypothetical protein
MINLTSPCCGVTAKYADANSSKYGCAGCGSGFTIEQAKAATDAAAAEKEARQSRCDKNCREAADRKPPGSC